MSLADHLAVRPRTVASCVTARAVAELDETDTGTFQAAMDGDYSSEFLAHALGKELGRKVAATSLDRHRKGRCCCDVTR